MANMKHLIVCLILILLSTLSISTTTNPFEKRKYTLLDQEETHYSCALDAYRQNDVWKSLRIFEYLSTSVNKNSEKYQYIIYNLAFLFFKLDRITDGIKWCKVAISYPNINLLSAFLLGRYLYQCNSLYDSFIVFRDIRETKTSMYHKYEPVIQYNMAILLSKLGGNGDVHFEQAIQKIGLQSPNHERFQKYRQAQSAKGLQFRIENGPLDEIALIKSNGDKDILPILPLDIDKIKGKQKQKEMQSPRSPRSPNIILTSPSSTSLAYYFTDPSELGPMTAPLPYAHQIPNHIDHYHGGVQEDYFTQKPHPSPTSNIIDHQSLLLADSRYPSFKDIIKPDKVYLNKNDKKNDEVNSENIDITADIIPKKVPKRPFLHRFHSNY